MLLLLLHGPVDRAIDSPPDTQGPSTGNMVIAP